MIFPIEVYDMETITTLQCIVLVRDEGSLSGEDILYTDLGQIEIDLVDIIQQGKVFQNTIVDSSRRYELQKSQGMRKVDGFIRITASIAFGTEDTQPLFGLFHNVCGVEKFTSSLQKRLKTGSNTSEYSIGSESSYAFGSKVKTPRKHSAPIISRRTPERSVVEMMGDIISQTLSLNQYDIDNNDNSEIGIRGRRFDDGGGGSIFTETLEGDQDEEFGLEDDDLEGNEGLHDFALGLIDTPAEFVDDSPPPPPMAAAASTSTASKVSRKRRSVKWTIVTALGSFVLIVCAAGILFAGPLSSYSVFSTVYVVKPLNCSGTVQTNESDWYENEWYMSLHAGACPSDGDRAFYFSKTGRLKSTIKYDTCLKFTSSDEWAEMDAANEKLGFSTDLVAGAQQWNQAYVYIVIATVLLYCIYPIIALGVRYRKRTGPWILFVLPMVIPTGVGLWVLALLDIKKSDQLKPDAWLAFFSECEDVKVDSSTGYQLGLSALFLSGSFALLFYIILFLYCCVSFSRENPFNAENAESGFGDDNNVKLPSGELTIRAAKGMDTSPTSKYGTSPPRAARSSSFGHETEVPGTASKSRKNKSSSTFSDMFYSSFRADIEGSSVSRGGGGRVKGQHSAEDDTEDAPLLGRRR